MSDQHMSALKAPFAAIPHVWAASRASFLLLSAFLVLQGLTGPLIAILLGRTADALPLSASTGEFRVLALQWAALIAVTLSSFPIVFFLSGKLNEDLTAYLQRLLLRRGLSIETLTPFDDPEIYDLMSLVLKESKSRPVNYIVLYSYILRSSISTIAYVSILWAFGWYVPLLMIAGALPLHRAFTALREANWNGIRQRAQEARYVDYLVGLSLEREPAMELRSFDMRPVLEEHVERVQGEMLRSLRRERAAGLIHNIPWIAVGALLYILAIYLLLRHASSVGMAVAGVVAGVQAFYSMQQAVTEVVENIAYLNEKAFFFRDLDTLMSLEERFGERAGTLGEGSAERSASVSQELSDAAAGGSVAGTSQLSGAQRREDRPGQSEAFLAFENVSFAYANSRTEALSGITFEVKAGEVVAIVGKNGAGKSTLLKLVTGFYAPSSGAVFCQGSRLTVDRLPEWRAQLSPIFQKTHALAFSFGDNIAMGRDGSLADLTYAQYYAFGDQPPYTLDDELGVEFGGSELSGGELQRLGIARAVFRDEPIVILDEPTSAIDPIFEREVFEAIREFVQGKTALLVTHRMGQAVVADRVIVLDEGRIVEQGTPEELRTAGGLFAEMVRAQVGE